MSITKMELCKRVSKRLNNRAVSDVKEVFEITLDEILSVLSEEERIEIRGFGAFNIKKRKARMGRNPRTGVIVKVPENKIPYFRFSEEAHKVFNKKRNGA